MNRLKGLAIGAACMIAVTSISVSAETVTKEIALDSVKIVVNGKAVQGTNLVYENSTYVPLRAVFETIGCTVNWDDATQTASINGEIKNLETSAGTFVTYEDADKALKDQYDVLITIAQQSGQDAEVTRLQQEFVEKEVALKAEWDEKTKESGPALNMQSEEVELNSITVLVNDKPVDAPTILYQNRTFVPLRAISDSLGCEVNWDEETRTASIYGEYVPPIIDDSTVDYAELKTKYDALIAEQIKMGDQRYDEVLKQSTVATGNQGLPQPELAEQARAPYYKRAEELKEEFAKKVESLKLQYNVTEDTAEQTK